MVKEFDKDKLMSALMSGVDINDCSPEDLENLEIEQDVDVEQFAQERKVELSEIQYEEDMAYNLTAIGGKRKIGPLEIDCVIGNIVLLNTIDSPFVSGEMQDEVAIEDIAQALYVLSEGKDVLDSVMQIAERIEDLYKLKDMCKGNPELSKELVDRVELISRSRIDFTKKALEFYYTHFTGDQVQEVFDSIFNIISDVVKSVQEVSSNIPVSEEKVKSKKKET